MAYKSQKLALLSLLKVASEPLSLSQLASRIGGIPQRTLRRWLSDWVNADVIEKLGQGKATHYRNKNLAVDPVRSLVFLNGLDNDLRIALLNQLRDLWTHHSTAIEGNTLTLGDTHFILEQGLTISGKPFKDHQEVIGHAKAIELLYKSLSEPLSESFLFNLHKAVLTDDITDIYKPAGQWKLETNGTYAITSEGIQKFIEYTFPLHVPELMAMFLDDVNAINSENLTIHNAHQCYAKIHMGFAHIHPFWDGNGRIARLIANIPLLKAGLPPLVISQETRRTYIQILANYQIKVGRLDLSSPSWCDTEQLTDFEDFCFAAYTATKNLIKNAFVQQEKRNH